MTPPVLTFSGMWVLVPANCRRPTTRLAYWTTMRRWPRSTKMIAATTATISATSSTSRIRPICPVRSWSKVRVTARGKFTTMPAKISSDIPLPMPRSVICSPSHITNIVPVVRVSTHISRKPQPGS